MQEHPQKNPRTSPAESTGALWCVVNPCAMAFVLPQPWETPLDAREALMQGSAFSGLVKPFLPGEVAK